MKKDIHPPKVENVFVATVKEQSPLGDVKWNVYLINSNEYPLEGVLITAKGYLDMADDSQIKTATFRHGLGTIAKHSFAQIEVIDPEVFHLNNEYWVSYFHANEVYDKKFIFLPYIISLEELVMVPVMNQLGVIAK